MYDLYLPLYWHICNYICVKIIFQMFSFDLPLGSNRNKNDIISNSNLHKSLVKTGRKKWLQIEEEKNWANLFWPSQLKQIFLKTFSPSERCLEAGWTVHQQASPEKKRISILTHNLVSCRKGLRAIEYQNVAVYIAMPYSWKNVHSGQISMISAVQITHKWSFSTHQT